jgi:hypothetical protein
MLLSEIIDPPREPTATDAFKRWFDGSQASDAQGRPLKLYHGTSKDADFKHFKMPKNGVWFARDPAEASTYASENDSQNSRWDAHKGNFVTYNTASRVIPVYLRLLKPKRVATMNELNRMLPAHLQNADNYRRTQGMIFDQLRAQGYDSVIIADAIYVLLDNNAPSKIKSAISNTEFSLAKKNIHETDAKR